MGTYEIAATTTIAVAPVHVWAVLDDVAGWTTWMPSMNRAEVHIQTPGAPQAGYRFRVQGGPIYADLELTHCTALERRTRFRLNFPPLTGDNSCVLVPLADGRHRLARVDHINLPGGVISVLNRTQRARFERLAREFLLALKRTVEARAQAATPPRAMHG